MKIDLISHGSLAGVWGCFCFALAAQIPAVQKKMEPILKPSQGVHTDKKQETPPYGDIYIKLDKALDETAKKTLTIVDEKELKKAVDLLFAQGQTLYAVDRVLNAQIDLSVAEFQEGSEGVSKQDVVDKKIALKKAEKEFIQSYIELKQVMQTQKEDAKDADKKTPQFQNTAQTIAHAATRSVRLVSANNNFAGFSLTAARQNG